MVKKRKYRKFGPIPEEWGVHTDEPIYFDAKGRKRVDKKKSKDTNNTKLNDIPNLEHRSTEISHIDNLLPGKQVERCYKKKASTPKKKVK